MSLHYRGECHTNSTSDGKINNGNDQEGVHPVEGGALRTGVLDPQ